MKGLYVLTLVLVLVITCATVQGATVYKITFDGNPSSPAPSPYAAGAGEILPTGISSVVLAGTTDIVAPTVPGFQGGNVLSQPLGGVWPNTQGYRFGADGTQYTGTPGTVIANAWTIEAVVNPDLSGCQFGKTDLSNIINSEQLGDGTPWGDVALYADQNTGLVTFNPSGQSIGVIQSTTALQSGQWYHIAAVVRPGTPQRTELWINGALEGVGWYPASWETQDLFKIPGYFNIGSCYWPVNARNWQGQIDAIAISDTALAYGSFVLPVESPAVMGGQVILPSYNGDLSTVGVEIQLRTPGSTTPSYTDRVFLDVVGNYRLSSSLFVSPGTYDVAFKTCSSLREVVPNVAIPGSVVNVVLTLGDVDGNNYVGTVDHSILSSNFNSTGDQ